MCLDLVRAGCYFAHLFQDIWKEMTAVQLATSGERFERAGQHVLCFTRKFLEPPSDSDAPIID